jgi:murein DD-endopeptidase MepM/ murein hydrolase activator NlpD
MENKISCSAGKTILIDPNSFEGQNSSDNMSVLLEDLSIYVQLETTKKARTILKSNGISNTFKSTEGAYITFIEGDNVAGKKSLTTSYTDLTTNLTEQNVQQALGISSIDIDFNSSYAPMIIINFIDVRGSAIFQNEENLENGVNKYSEFFNLPYPIFTLTIKGYYGMPVRYNLHLTKFNARFNSQTGNFEITANFIGYTYAMLSDMLIGYLRAIEYTKKGGEKYRQLKESRPNIKTLDELAEIINKIDDFKTKLQNSDPKVDDINRLNSKLDIISNLKSNINRLGQNEKISFNIEVNDFKFVIINPFNSLEEIIKSYNDIVIEDVKFFNDEMFSNISLNEKDLNFSNVKSYKGLTIDLLNSTGDTLSVQLYQASDKNKIKEELKSYIKENNINIGKNVLFDVFDFREHIELLNTTETNLKKEGNNLKKEVAELLQTKIKDDLGFLPTIRNIVSSLTTAVEVFMSVLYEVSTEALKNPIRTSELEKKFGSYDYKPSSTNNTSSNDASGVLEKNYFPWPEYRETDQETKSYVEKYLGNVNELDPTKIDELIFINDLLEAFIKSEERISNIEIESELEKNNWIPVNPIDSRIFIDFFPYKRIQGNTKEEVISLLMERAFIYMGYSNFKLSKEEIIEMANKESEAILGLIDNDVIKKSLSQLTKDDFINVKAKNDGDFKSLIKKSDNDVWYYNFIFELPNSTNTQNAKHKKVLPITTKNNKFEFDFKALDGTKNKEEEGEIFLTNYRTSYYEKSNPNTPIFIPNVKEDDGGVYIKVISPDTYKASIRPTSTVNVSSVLSLNVLKSPQTDFNKNFNNVGFSQFSGPYSIQDYKVLNFDVTEMQNAEYRIMFYSDNDNSNEPLNIGSLCYKRPEKVTTPYDITDEKIKQFETVQLAIDNTVGVNSTTHASLGQNRLLLSSLIEEKSNKITIPFIGFQIIGAQTNMDIVDKKIVGLFGSRLYNEQSNNHSPFKYSADYAKALLFLHSLPWNGLYSSQNGKPKGIFNVNEILNTFGNRAGFISAPKLWVAFIGGMLWRADNNQPTFQLGTKIINGGGSGKLDPIKWVSGTESLIPSYKNNMVVPTKLQYLKEKSSYAVGSIVFPYGGSSFMGLDNVLLQLPEQVKNEFKQVFFDFVQLKDEVSDWVLLKDKLEVFDTSINWVNSIDTLFTSTIVGGGLYTDGTISKTKMLNIFNKEHNGKKTLNDYNIFSSYKSENDLKYNFMTELKDDSDGVSMILELLTQEVYLVNTTYRIWQQDEAKKDFYEITSGIFVSDDDLNTFISACMSNFTKQNNQSVDEKKRQIKNELFGTDNINEIKFNLYRSCKNIYDKWIGGTDSLTNLMFGNDENRNGLDKELAGIGNELRLIDSFRFVNRSFRDIGDEFIINPTPLLTFLKENQNSSFYAVVTSLLSANNFDFIALPSFINYDENILSNLFKPMTLVDGLNDNRVGPSFVCVYVGQTSKILDFKSSEYPNDGVDFRCNSENGLTPTSGLDFFQNKEPNENNVPVFSVNYSQQNQNIFKDIILDQNEFTETAESLKIVDDISNRGTYGGQNIFNVYSVRSYTAEVEMMGNAMIQPMMYFQLNNIPMFHGAYMITHVKHNIKPNYMSTSFSGVRIRNVETKLMKESEFYLSLLDSIGIEPIDDTVISDSNTEDSFPPPAVSGLFVDPFDNDKKVLVSSAPGLRARHGSEKEHKGVDFSIETGTNLIAIYDGEIESIKYNYKDGYGYGLYIVINHGEIDGKVYKSIYGHISELDKKTFGKNISELNNSEINQILGGYNPKIKVNKGQIIGKSGGKPKQGYLDNINQNYDLAGGSDGPHLHFEIRTGGNETLKTSVFNLKYINPIPYLPLANYVTYKNKKNEKSNDKKEILTGPNADFWSLIAICSLEAVTPQGRADVAQSIYNRLATPNKLYGKSIKEIIVAKKQYKPTFNNLNDWNLINDQNSAVIAIMGSKNWTKEQTIKALKDTKDAILNVTYQRNSRSFIDTRTQFLAETPTSTDATGVVEREPKNQNNAFYWEYGGKLLIGKNPPSPINWSDLNVNTNIT